MPQPIQLQIEVKTLNDVQKLAGMINWIRPYVGIPCSKLQPLFELLKGDTNILAPRMLTEEAKKVVAEIEQALSSKHVWRLDLAVSVQAFVLVDQLVPFAVIAQWCEQWDDPLHVLK